MEQTKILGLSVNTRMLGLAVISGHRLLDYEIKLRKDPWTLRKRETILTSLQPWCKHYNIKCVALSIPYEKQTSSQTKELMESIKSYFSKKKIGLCPYPAKTFQTFCQEAKVKTKKEMMRRLALQYPELSHCYRKEVSNKNKYYVKLFEAVAVATIHAQRLKGKRKDIERTGL